MSPGYKKNCRNKAFYMFLIVLLLSLFAGGHLDVKAAVTNGTRVLAFTSDVHNKSTNVSRNRLERWIDLQREAYGRIDYMGFCGDMGDASSSSISESQFWDYSKAAIDMVVGSENLDACFTTGNHEYQPANFGTTSNTTKNYYTVDGETKNGNGYHIYCLGSAGSSEKYTEQQISKLTTYFNSLSDSNPVIVLTHFPLHYYTSGSGWGATTRTIQNAGSVIDALNGGVTNGRKVILLWGHNHSRDPKDTHYDQIYTPGTSLTYASNSNKTIQFYYGAAGCMSDQEYIGSKNVLGKGLIILIDDQNKLKFTYFNADRTEIAGYTETGFAGEISVTVSVNPTTLSMQTGDVSKVQATVSPQSAADKGVTWESDDASVAAVDSNGNVTAKSPGTVHIKATTKEGNKSASCTVTVSPKPGTTYTITWLNDNNDVLRTDQVEYGKTPSYGSTPTKASTAQYSYTFSGWTPEIKAVTGPATYKATYSQTVMKYTITWKNDDGTDLKTENLEYGATPKYSGTTPTKASTAQYTYSHSGWTPSINTVTKDTTYTATFSQTTRKYTITWKNDDGTNLKTEDIEYGATPKYSGTTPTKASTAQYEYSHSGWTPSIQPVTKNATYTATFSQSDRKYTITWKNDDGSTLDTEKLAYGATPKYSGPTPTKASTAQYEYSHSGWTPSIQPVTKDVTYTATFSQTTRKYTITWKNEDGSVLKTEDLNYGATPKYSGTTPTKASTAQYSYSFSGWSPGITTVSKAVTYTATFSQTVRKYTITWKNDDGSTLTTDQVAYGTTPKYSGTEPTKASTAQYSYSFSGWSPSLTSVTKDASYTATFSQKVRKYTITWKNEDGSTLKTEDLEYGATPKYSGTTPTKASTAQYSYSFNGWSPSITTVSKAVTYTATYSQTVRKYTITWKNDDGSTLKTEDLEYGATPKYSGTDPTKASTAQYSYSFSGWSPSITTVSKAVTYTATFSQTVRKYTITWKNDDGSTLKTEDLEYGATPKYSGTTPTKASTAQYSYSFSGWSPSITTVSKAATYTAVFTQSARKYTITWKNDDGSTLKTEDLAYGTTPKYSGSDPTKASTAQYSYTFNGWSPAITTVSKDATYTATFTQTTRKYTITWKNDDGSTLKTEELTYGATPKYSGTDPTKASTAQYNYTFSGWSPTIATVSKDGTYTATYSQTVRKYTITWKNDDGSTLKTEELAYGATPKYSGTDPTKASTAQYNYSFSGWSPTIATVSKDASYTATYSQTTRKYTITWKNDDGSTLKTEELTYGETPKYSGTEPTKASTTQYSYSFSGWSPAITTVSKAATYTATFTQTTRKYTITWKNDDGSTLKTEEVAYGETPKYSGTEPSKASTAQYNYSFNGWSPAIQAVNKDATYTATYSQTTRKYTITWKNDDGTTLKTEDLTYGATPSYSGETPKKATTAQYNYSFEGWSPAITTVSKDATYTATYSQTTRKYTITWKNDDGSTLKTEELAYGTKPAYSGDTPKKASTVQYTYTFKGWTPELAEVSKDATYTATFTQATRKYTITWKNDDGSTIKTEDLAYGTTPSYSGETPKKASTAQYTYTFKGWTPELAEVSKDATYTATFTQADRKYTITWKNDDGTTLKTEELTYGATPKYNGTEPTKASTAQYNYSFEGWSPAITTVSKDATYTATYSQTVRKYTITWKNDDGTTLKTEDLNYGTTPSYSGETPKKAATAQYTYSFKGWTPDISPVNKDAVYTAVYNATINKYKVRFVDADDKDLKSEKEYEYGTRPEDIEQPIVKAKTEDDGKIYYFAGWTPEIAEVRKDVVYKATYSTEEKMYTISFVDDDGTELLSAVEYPYATKVDDIEKPQDPVKKDTAQYSYSFAGWQPGLSDVLMNTVYRAVYDKKVKEYTITWKNADGSILETDKNVPYGSKVSYDGKTPQKAADSKNSYTFTGWSPAVGSDTIVTGNASYTAQYKAVPVPVSNTAKRSVTVQDAQKAPVDNSLPVMNTASIKLDASANMTGLKVELGAVSADEVLVEYRQAGESSWKAAIYKAGSSVTITGMKANGTYEIRFTTVGNVNGSIKKGKPSQSTYRWMKKAKAKKIKTGKKQMTVSWKKVKKASGYEIRYSTDKSFKKNVKKVTVKGNKKLTRTVKGLKNGKTYYVSVSPYKKKGGKKYIGVSGGVKKAKIKK